MKRIDTIKDKHFLTLLNEVKKEILKVLGDKLVQLILYGSYARNEQDPESDIDIMILVDESDSALRKYNFEIADIMTELSLKYEKLISLTDETYSRYIEYLYVLPFFRNIYYEGVEIYGKNSN
jgi:predicted nucleotidyltransferase